MHRSRATACGTVVCVAALCATSACGLIESQSDPAEVARVSVGGTSPVPLELITSSDFDLSFNPETGVTTATLVVADTVTVSLPFEQTYDVSALERFLVRLTNADSTVAAVQFRVFLDGLLQYDQEANMSDGGSL